MQRLQFTPQVEAAKLAEQKRAEKLAEKRAAKLAEKRAEEEAARKETLRLKREAAEHAAKLAKAEERGRQRAIKLMEEKEAIAQAESKAYEEELEEGKRVKALFARKEEQERREREALEELRAEKLARERAAQKAAAAEAKARRDAEFAQAMAEIASAKEAVTVTDDGAKKETVMVTPTAPLITVAGDAGMTHSYPQRTFKPEEPKTTETVTLKTGGETGGVVDHTLFACVSLAVLGFVGGGAGACCRGGKVSFCRCAASCAASRAISRQKRRSALSPALRRHSLPRMITSIHSPE